MRKTRGTRTAIRVALLAARSLALLQYSFSGGRLCRLTIKFSGL